MTPASDLVTVSVTVATDPQDAFVLFTEEIDHWWRRGPKFRIAGRERGLLRFEPRLGGRLIEEYESSAGPRAFTKGEITAWQPPERFAFEWRGVNFAPGESTHVEVCFEAVPTGTRVTVRHSGWAALRPDHPARHGQPAPAFLRSLGLWWGELMTSYREFIDARPAPGQST